MISKNQIKHIQSLHLKKFREIHHEFIAEGSTIVLDLVHSSYGVKQIFAREDWISSNHEVIRKMNIPVSEVKELEMERISALSSSGPVLAVLKIPETNSPPVPDESQLVLMLDEIRDPGNLGTIIRIADWFGIGTVYCSENTADVFNPKVVQATMGSIARVPVHYCDLKDVLRKKSDSVKVFGTFLSGENIYNSPLSQSGIIIIGNESDGISLDINQYVNFRIFVPSFSDRAVSSTPDSLNAAVATAIICSEFRRRNNF